MSVNKAESVEFYADESWIELAQDAEYLISTRGRLYDTRRRRIVPVSRVDDPKYSMSWSIRSKPGAGSANRYAVCARAVLLSFCGDGKGVVFADGNENNVSLENLSWRVQLTRTGRR